MSQGIPQSPVTVPPPRPVTPAVHRRAWAEPRVRIWLLAAAAILALAIYWTIAQVSSWYTGNRLIREGVRTEAAVYVPQDFNAGNRIPNRRIAIRQPVVIEWTHGEQSHHANAVLDHEMISGETVPIYIDPADPADFTTRTSASSLTGQLFGLAILLPAGLIAGAIAWIQQRRVLSLYQAGEIHPAIVVETRSNALTPESRQVRCTLLDSPDKRIITVALPRRYGNPGRGDTIPVITAPGGSDGGLAAAAYQG